MPRSRSRPWATVDLALGSRHEPHASGGRQPRSGRRSARWRRAPAFGGSRRQHRLEPCGAAGTGCPPLGDQAEGVRGAGRILGEATGARWPMYLRNVKQILRQSEGGFDERRYGFGGLMDLLKACQREGFVRVERDRRGGLRVFQGSALQGTVQRRRQPLQPSEPAAAGRRRMRESADRATSRQPASHEEAADGELETIGRCRSTPPRSCSAARRRGSRARASRVRWQQAPKRAAAKSRPRRSRHAPRKKRSSDDDAGNR